MNSFYVRVSGTDEYRGLRPGSKLVTTHKGQAFELAFMHRELDSGTGGVPGL
ncbi:Site-specific recombinase [Pseudomonas amygdali pv. lachrymans]|nr:Site-specific recombinase [Pseudomonas amygdali pv. lachrymans]